MTNDGSASNPAVGDERRRPRIDPRVVLALLGLIAVVVAIHSLMGRRNFTGWDEWLYLDLTSRGLVGFPHSNRPLALLGVVAAPWLSRSPFDGFHLLHAVYMSGLGLATVAVARRLLGGALLPWCAGLVAAVWAPTDLLRLATILTSVNMSDAFCTVAAIALLVESWWRGSRWLLAASVVVAIVAIRGYEPAAVLLVGAPLALFVCPKGGRTHRLQWFAVFGLGLAAGALLALIPSPGIEREQLYQAGAALELRPLPVVTRLAAQLRSLLLPALRVPPLVISAGPAVWLAPALVLLGGLLVVGAEGDHRSGTRSAPAVLSSAGLVGLAWMLLALLPFSLSAAFEAGSRAQFLSAPGVGVFLAAVAGSLTTGLGRRLRGALVLAVTAWLVFVAAGRTAAMQTDWTERSVWPRQRALLGRLAVAAPDVRPGTLFILIDQSRAFESTFAFRHAVRYLYEGRAAGWIVSSQGVDLFYPTRLAEDGVHADVWPAHQRAWGESPRVYAYHETVVVWVEPEGALWLLGTWPATALPALPRGARYAPRERLLGGAPSRIAQRLLADVR